MTTTTHPADSFTGDSTGIHRLVGNVQRDEIPAYTCSTTLANQALATLIAQQPRRLAPAASGSVFAADPRRSAGDPVTFLPKSRLLTPDEQRTAVACFARAVADGALTSGPAAAEFEDALAEFLAVPHAVATSSGTDALIIALRAVGVGPGARR